MSISKHRSRQINSAQYSLVALKHLQKIAVRVRLWPHIKEILSLADLLLDMLSRAEFGMVRGPLGVRIGRDLELKLGQAGKAKGAVPACVLEPYFGIHSMGIRGVPLYVSMYRSLPSGVVAQKAKAVDIGLHIKMNNIGHALALAKKVDQGGARNFIDVSHD